MTDHAAAAHRALANPDTPNEPDGFEPDGSVSVPIDLMSWVDANRASFQPPVGNKYLYSGRDFFAMVIAGPNARNDFHKVDSEEFFIQLKGDIVVKTWEDGRIIEHCVREGETFFIPPNVPHAPCRPPDTLGLVVERRRPAGEIEHQIFYCENCGSLVHDQAFDCKDIVQHFRDAMESFWADDSRNACPDCGTRVLKPGPYELPEKFRRS
jgi:3-hydroxyanthranilate 3,4-dioxygenase